MSIKYDIIDGEKFLIFDENANDGDIINIFSDENNGSDESSFNSDIILADNSESNNENPSRSNSFYLKGKIYYKKVIELII